MAEAEHTRRSSEKSPPSTQKAAVETDVAPGVLPLSVPLRVSAPPDPRRILRLQRMIGNQATIRLLQREGSGGGTAAPVAPERIDPLTVVLTGEQYETCFDAFKTKPDWNAVKAFYIDEVKDQQFMAQMWAFRRKYVVDLLKDLRATKYPNLLMKSAGSNDLGSDYDITVASPGNDNDVKAIEDFNNTVKAVFGVQPGTLFDTNLYAKDYGAISQSDEFKDGGQTYATDTVPGHTAAMAAIEEDVQDVAALIKVRRFMTQPEWDSYVEDLLSQVETGKRAAVARKYDEADGIYQICVAELLGQVREALGEEEQHASLEHAQQENAEHLHEASEEHSDTVLEQSNQLYLGRMSKIRSIQAGLTQLENQMATLEALGDVTPALGVLVEQAFGNPNRNLPQRIEAERSQVKQLLGEAIFFAAEAYISQGAIRHVVAGIQGTKLTDDEKRLPKTDQDRILAEKRTKANNALTMGDLMQSFNEQLGDFLKDFGHLGSKSDATFYIKSAKYVDRMLDVLIIMRNRLGDSFPRMLGIERATGKTLDSIVASVKELYSARADPNTWGAERESRAVAIAVDMGVDSRGHYKTLLIQLGAEVSALIRNQMPAAADGDTEMEFFQNRNTAFD